MERVTRFVIRFPAIIAVLAILLTALGTFGTVRLYSEIRPDLEELLPRDSRSVHDLDQVRDRLQALESLTVLVLSENPDASRRFVDDLAARIAQAPKSIVAGVEHRIDREAEFFRRRQALFLEVDELREIRDYIVERLDYERELLNPLNIFSGVEIPEPRLDLRELVLRQADANGLSRYPRGYYATPDERKRAIIVYQPTTGPGTGIPGAHRLREEVDRAIREVSPGKYSPDIQIRFTGGVQNLIEEHEALVEDIERSSWIVGTIVFAGAVLFFRSVLATLAMFAALLMARAWTLGLTWVTIGHLNANSAFMGAIVLGAGITYGVMVLARYLEERRSGALPDDAARTSISASLSATWTAAICAGIGYGSLALTDFEGFRQYGYIGFMAMLLCWGSALFVLPALLLLVERHVRPITQIPPGKWKVQTGILVRMISFLMAHPISLLLISGAITAVSILHISRFDWDRSVETDLTKIRSKESFVSGSGYWSEVQDEIFKAFLSPVVILASSQKEAVEIASELKKKSEADGPNKLITSVRSIEDFIPPRQREKIELLKEIRYLLPADLVAELSKDDRIRLKPLFEPEALRPFQARDLPELVLRKFTEKGGEIGRLVLVEPPLGSRHWSGAELIRFVRDVRGIADRVTRTHPPATGSHPVYADMIEAIRHDGPRATLMAFLAVVLFVLLMFRRSWAGPLAIFSLFMGVLWTVGFSLGQGIKVNFLNFIALPITFGTGIDYSVNILGRYIRDPNRNLVKALTQTGSAVTFCSFTTCVGYFALLIARNQAFVSFGLLAIAGELAVMVAALVLIPALLSFGARRRRGARAAGALPEEGGKRAA